MTLKLSDWASLAEEGTLDAELRDSLTSNIAGVREMPGFLAYSAQRRSTFQSDYREFVEDVLKNGATNSEFEALYRSNSSE